MTEKDYAYFDKHGREIEAGDTLLHDDGVTIEKVLLCGNDEDGYDLGIDANNYDSPHLTTLMAYPLSQFNLEEWSVMSRNLA